MRGGPKNPSEVLKQRSKERKKNDQEPEPLASGDVLHKIKYEFDFDEHVPDDQYTENVKQCILDILTGKANPSKEYEIAGVAETEPTTYDSPIAYLQRCKSLSVLRTILSHYGIETDLNL
jgi:hypothetical protein